jgi:hypothetical protein
MVIDRHRWVYDLLEKQDQLEDMLGVRLGEILGCGYFGCVVATDGPWVVKLTVDETEGPIWSAVEDVVTRNWGQTGEHLAGWPRVREIVELQPGVSLHGRELKLYAIVREAAEPAFARWGPTDYVSTHATLKALGMNRKMIEQGYDPVSEELRSQPRYVTANIMHDLVHLQDRGRATRKQMLEIAKKSTRMIECLKQIYHYNLIGKEVRDVYLEWYEDQAEAREGAVLHFVGQVASDEVHLVASELEDNEFGEPLGELFQALVDETIVLADVHAMNLGWRQHATVDGDTLPKCLMVIDPGATPTVQRTVIERRMIANGRWLG